MSIYVYYGFNSPKQIVCTPLSKNNGANRHSYIIRLNTAKLHKYHKIITGISNLLVINCNYW